MGDRGLIYIEDTKKYIYTHWLGSNLTKMISKTLKENKRLWHNPKELTEVLYADLINANGNTRVGLNLSKLYTETHLYIKLNCKQELISILHDIKVSYIGSFEVFINDTLPEFNIQNKTKNNTA